MANAGILHRIYTNAAEDDAWEGARGRVVSLEQADASRSLTPDVLSALDDLLRKTSPASTRTGWVVCRFVADGGQTYACAIASYPDLVHAADGREGVLNHARLVRADGPSFDAAALIEAAEAFPLADVCAVPSGQRLRAYLDEVSNDTSVLVRPIEMSELQKVPQDVITGVLLGCLSTLGRRERVSLSIADAPPSVLARAWAALPFAAQRTSAWAAGVSESCPVDVLFSSQGKSPAQTSSKTLVDCVTQYVRLLRDAPQTVSAMLANPALKDATALATAVQRAALAPELSSVSGREEMSKKERATKPDSREPRSDWQPLASDVQSEMNRQFKAMEEVLRRELDDRLTTFEAKLRSQSPSRPQTSPLLASLLPVWITLGVLVLAALGWFGYQTFASRRVTPRETTRVSQQESDVREEEPEPPAPRAVPAMTPPQAAVARAEASEKWAEELKALVDGDAMFVANAVSAVARRDEVPREANAALTSFAARIARNEDLQASGREKLRALLIDCLAADVDGATVKIDGKLADVAPYVDALRSRYRVTNTSTDATQMSLQSEILLRWLAELER